MTPSPRLPVLVFDGDCAICSTLARFAARWIRDTELDYVIAPWQQLDLPGLGLTEHQCIDALQWVGRDGAIRSAQDAVASALWSGRPWWRPAGALIRAPGVNQLAGVVYRWVAANRSRLPGGTPACSMPPAERSVI